MTIWECTKTVLTQGAISTAFGHPPLWHNELQPRTHLARLVL